jgi:hypothetical protein
MLIAGLYLIMDYSQSYIPEFITMLAMGSIMIPVLSIVLLGIAVLIWPRKRRALEQMQVIQTKKYTHWYLILAAFLLLPYANLALTNPFFSAGSINIGQAERMLTRLLSNTYYAFNLKDEDALFDILAQNVSGDLVGDIYLNSRRRLNAGVRQGSEVKVREVKILSLDHADAGRATSDGITYQGKWMVTARVRHLQHIHHRQNIYSGLIRVRREENRWKIEHMELLSEDRVIISGSSG